MIQGFNYKHLFYFWVVAKEGSLTRAATRLDMAIQTISAQIRLLESDLGAPLFRAQGRTLALTEAGLVALREADHIFDLGQQLTQRVQDAVSGQRINFAVGVSDGLAKLAVHRLLQPILNVPRICIKFHEGELDDLQAELVTHKIDVILTDRPVQANAALRLHSHAMGTACVAWYAGAHFSAKEVDNFPDCLASLPILLPTRHSIVREHLDHWFDRVRVLPRIVGEFEDSAMLKMFGANGLGVYPVVDWYDDYLAQSPGVRKIGVLDDVKETFYLVHPHKKIDHPLLKKLTESMAAA